MPNKAMSDVSAQRMWHTRSGAQAALPSCDVDIFVVTEDVFYCRYFHCSCLAYVPLKQTFVPCWLQFPAFMLFGEMFPSLIDLHELGLHLVLFLFAAHHEKVGKNHRGCSGKYLTLYKIQKRGMPRTNLQPAHLSG